MEKLTFDRDNNNIYTINFQGKVNFTYHINTSDFNLLHGHEDYWEFTVITDGHLINELNGKDMLLGPHSLFITSPRDFHRLKKPAQYKDEKLRYFNIIVRENKLFKILNSISHNLVDWFYKNTTFEPFPETLELMIDSTLHRINLIEKNNPVLYNDMICSALLIIIQYVYGQSINQIYVDDPWANELYKKMQSVDFVKLNVEGLCDEMGYSRTQMNRLMKQHFNQTPHEFIMDNKLKYAEALLITSDMSLSEIVEVIGYSSLSSFIENFKEKYQLTPSKFRRTKRSH